MVAINRCRRLNTVLPVLLLALGIATPVWSSGQDPSWSALVDYLVTQGERRRIATPQADQALTFVSRDSGAAGPAQAAFTKTRFHSAVEAVTHAMNHYNPRSVAEDREYIGAIYQLSAGEFMYSVAPGQAGANEISASIPRLNCTRFVAFWHTHGAPHWTRKYFSETDSRLVKQWQLPFYMAAADGKLRVLLPEHKPMTHLQARRRGLGNRSGYAVGKVVAGIDIAVR